MVLIFSENSDDSTNWVIDWLYYYKVPFMRINRDDDFDQSFPLIQISNAELIENSDYTSIWFRRSIDPHYENEHLIKDERDQQRVFSRVSKNLFYEYSHASQFLFSTITRKKPVLGNPQAWRINKLQVLEFARLCQLTIPETIITCSKKHVTSFYQRYGTVITKPISELYDLRIKNEFETQVYINYTEELTESMISQLPDTFFYSLFQQKIEKEIEIRVFFLHGKCFSMAIFSQADSQTRVDFRKYTNNRNVPYALPHEIEDKLRQLMGTLKLNSGSIDLIKTPQGEYVFLEVNPTGQYGMISDPCNYHLDKLIAESLIVNAD